MAQNPEDFASAQTVQAAIAALKKAQADYQAKLNGRQPSDSGAHTFIYAPEIEEGLVGIAWHEPERLATIYRELDVAVHLSQPHLRWMLEAIDLAWRDLGEVSWESVIQVLRETKHLEDCGGLEGCNRVYRIEEAGSDLVSVEPDVRIPKPGWKERTEKIFGHYMEMLKEYAIHRNMDPPRPVYHFVRSQTTLYRNKVKRRESDADYLGEIRVTGRRFGIKVWKSVDGEFLNLDLKPL